MEMAKKMANGQVHNKSKNSENHKKQDQKDLLNLPLYRAMYFYIYSDVFTMKGKIQLK